MTRKTSISSFLLSREQASALKLKDQAVIILIPKHIVDKAGAAAEPVFDLVIQKEKLSLETAITPKPETDQEEVYLEKD